MQARRNPAGSSVAVEYGAKRRTDWPEATSTAVLVRIVRRVERRTDRQRNTIACVVGVPQSANLLHSCQTMFPTLTEPDAAGAPRVLAKGDFNHFCQTRSLRWTAVTIDERTEI
jgi:hypothetical protein